MLAKKLIAAAGNAGGESLYVEDVFSTYLYTGDGTTDPFPIVNGIDLANEGGLVWHKMRSLPAQSHVLVDTERGGSSFLTTNSTNAATTVDIIDSFNEDGFDLALNTITNESAKEYATWTFRKAEKFFDVVTYTGDGVAGRTISHNLGSTPAVMIIKNLTSSGRNWEIYHESLGNTKSIEFTAGAAFTWSGYNNTSPTDSVFTVSADPEVNANGQSFVAYLFASDAGGFGDDGSENIIKCGSYTGNGSTTGPEIDLGFEPQWLMIKASSANGAWYIQDSMRGLTASGANDAELYANLTAAEFSRETINVTSTGFQPAINHSGYNSSGVNYIYIAIRRPMKTPESGTEVFAIDTRSATTPAFTSNFPVDFFSYRDKTGSDWYSQSRLTGGGTLYFNLTGAENSIGGIGNANFEYQDGVMSSTANIPNLFSYMFKRATGFFDVVAYSGDGTTNQTENHNLGVVPEFIITKRRSSTYSWNCYVSALGEGKYTSLNSVSGSFTDTSIWNNTAPTSTQFTLGSFRSNFSGETYIAYLFATLDGISKVGSYTGTGSSQNIDCGFSSGARFILIKNVSDNADWLVYDSERGIVAGNDPYLAINSTAAEVTNTDYIDPLNAGFIANGSNLLVNKSGDTYIFLAIA